MKTSELIKQARCCRKIEMIGFCGDGGCPYFHTKGRCINELLNNLADKLELANNVLQKINFAIAESFDDYSLRENAILNIMDILAEWYFQRGDEQ